MYPEDIKDRIAEMLASESLRRICAKDGMPNRSTVERWMDADPHFAAKCARAREDHAERIFDGMEEIEDAVLDGTVKPDAAKVVLSSRQWRAEKLKPRKFGAKIETTLEVGESVSRIVREIFDPK